MSINCDIAKVFYNINKIHMEWKYIYFKSKNKILYTHTHIKLFVFFYSLKNINNIH